MRPWGLWVDPGASWAHLSSLGPKSSCTMLTMARWLRRASFRTATLEITSCDKRKMRFAHPRSAAGPWGPGPHGAQGPPGDPWDPQDPPGDPMGPLGPPKRLGHVWGDFYWYGGDINGEGLIFIDCGMGVGPRDQDPGTGGTQGPVPRDQDPGTRT